MLDIPPEVLATAFEIGIWEWGISYLPTVCLVCREWNEVAKSTPHLWGIIQVDTKSRPHRLLAQLSRAKATPLTIYISRGVHMCKPNLEPVVARLIELSENWIGATIPSKILQRCKWSDLRRSLEDLEITDDECQTLDPRFFDLPERDRSGPPALRALSIGGIVGVEPLLSPSIRHFVIGQRGPHYKPIVQTLDHLRRIPNVRTLSITGLRPSPLHDYTQVIRLNHLTTLKLTFVPRASQLLSSIVCPALQQLTISTTQDSMTPFLSQWCNPIHTPTSLHTLDLEQCIIPTDVPYLIRFLARLPELLRLSIFDERLSDAPLLPATDENNIVKALASSSGARSVSGGSRLCPALTTLEMSTDSDFQDLLELAAQRGNTSGSGSMKTLRTVGGYLCAGARAGQMIELRQLVENVECECLGCSMDSLALRT